MKLTDEMEQIQLCIASFVYSSRRIYAQSVGDRVLSPIECGVLYDELPSANRQWLIEMILTRLDGNFDPDHSTTMGKLHGLELVTQRIEEGMHIPVDVATDVESATIN